MTNALPLTCPVCGEKTNRPPRLIPDGKTLRCPKGHSFDVSAKGYVNLLLTQHKNVKDPGDSKEMAAARRLFLDSGAYSGLRDALCGCAAKYAAEFPKPVTMVDCGCGEGYYTVGMYDAVPGMQIIGVDISKNVLASAHSRINSNGMKRNIFCAAASVFRLPLEDACADMAAVIFAPFQREELLRVVKPGGVILTAIPGERHLYGLKSVLYDEPRLNEGTTPPCFITAFCAYIPARFAGLPEFFCASEPEPRVSRRLCVPALRVSPQGAAYSFPPCREA